MHVSSAVKSLSPELTKRITAHHCVRNAYIIHLVIIDGGADYIKDVNEPTESNWLVKFYEELSIKYQTPVIVIVHVNPNSDKERGHFGSQLQRKSESILTVTTDGDVSCLNPKFLKMAGKSDIPSIRFKYDKSKGYHIPYVMITPEGISVKDQERIEENRSIAHTIFNQESGLAYADAIAAIMKHTKKKELASKERFKEMRAHEMIKQKPDKTWILNINSFEI